MNIIRKLSIGDDYKNAMHYIVNQKVFGESTIFEILKDSEKEEYIIWIKQGSEILKWKSFNFNMPISVEYNINF